VLWGVIRHSNQPQNEFRRALATWCVVVVFACGKSIESDLSDGLLHNYFTQLFTSKFLGKLSLSSPLYHTQEVAGHKSRKCYNSNCEAPCA
jgi:hypothetical protein